MSFSSFKQELNAFQPLMKVPKGVIFPASVLFIAVIFTLNYLLGFELFLTAFLVIPVYLASWFVGFRAGLFFSGLTALYPLVNLLILKVPPLPATLPLRLGNCLALFFFFALVAYLASALKKEMNKTYEQAHIDALTGLLNTRAFLKAAERERIRTKRSGEPLTFCMLDLDNFKQVNDKHGHLFGDYLLKEMGQTIQKEIRQTDLAVRLGGDEFGILFPQTGFSGVDALVGKIHLALVESFQKNGWGVTPSVGVATFYETPYSVEEMLAKADKCLYHAKRAGKNQIVIESFGGPAQKAPSGISGAPVASPAERKEAPKGKMRVLLVEDNPGDALLVEKIFQNYGEGKFNLSCKSTLEDALKIIPTRSVDAVLLDLMLPDSPAEETLSHVSAFAAAVPLLVLSGFNDPELAAEALRMGAHDYLVKEDVLKNGSLVRALNNSVERHHFWQSTLSGKV